MFSAYLKIGILALAFPFTQIINVQAATLAPDFSLSDTSGQSHSLQEYRGKYVVLEWSNPDCPFVKKHYRSQNMQKLQKKYTEEGVIWLIINSSAKGKQGSYSPEEYRGIQKNKGYESTAVLLDPTGTVGKSYGAKTTPHMYIISPDGEIIYKGAIDSIRSADMRDVQKAENYVSKALDEALAGKQVSVARTDSYGCSVKYQE